MGSSPFFVARHVVLHPEVTRRLSRRPPAHRLEKTPHRDRARDAGGPQLDQGGTIRTTAARRFHVKQRHLSPVKMVAESWRHTSRLHPHPQRRC